MKHFVRIAKLLVGTMLILLVSIAIIEYSRLRETQKTMSMFTRIAGNYALTASQGADELIGSNRRAVMYDKNEYGEYLNRLNDACNALVDDNTTKSLRIAYKVLKWDYDRAMSENPDNLDSALHYTPLSFNLPYLSYDMTVECYNDAMRTMVREYSCKGRPSIVIAGEGGMSLTDNTGTVLPTGSITANGAYNYGGLSFNVVKLDSALIRSIYGNEDYYNNKIVNVFNELETDLFNDYRYTVEGGGGDMNPMIPQYEVSFNTPWYYATESLLLQFGRNASFGGTDSAFVSYVNSSNGSACYNHNDDGMKWLFGDKNRRIADGQLLFYAETASANFSYTFLS